MSVYFEAMMLICFGLAWPASIYKLWKTKKSQGKSIVFLMVIFVGYFFGILFNLTGPRDKVIYLYALNMLMVFVDLVLTWRYRERASQ